MKPVTGSACFLIASYCNQRPQSRRRAIPPAAQAIAQQQCARCHDVSKGGAFKKMPPSFQSIAIYRTKPDIWSRIIAPSPHAAMPDMTWTLTAEEVQDVLAYILSLDVAVSLPQ